MSVQHTILVSMTAEEMSAVSDPIFKVLNSLLCESGYTFDQVLMAALYSIGAVIEQRGVKLFLDSPLKRALPPLVAGYEAAQKDKRAFRDGERNGD